eukprot:comp21934_c0_seq1/m.49968 comp21934_c0_seq1/g.49968  ORF comp21934_c0_seq1/g.49968 comp21934_c0_seq1/m.49968 type:complete len:419 (-) comp21934_c0_seq1:35-1291(-)
MSKRVFVAGVGMTPFVRPGTGSDYPEMGEQACQNAMTDAGVTARDIESAVVGYVYGDSTCGQRVIYQLGTDGIPIYNVNNNCSTGSSALLLAKQMIAGGSAECVLVLGFEKMSKGSLGAVFTDRTNPMDRHVEAMSELRDITGAPMTAQIFGNAGREHMEKFGTTANHFAKIAEKNHRHSANNPYSQFREIYSLDQIKSSPVVYSPLTKLQCCPTSDGAAAAVLCSEAFLKRRNLQARAVEILAMAMATDPAGTFESKSCMALAGYDMSKRAAQQVYAEAKLTPADVQVVELHDCFSANELITYEALGLCPVGKAGEFIDRGDNTYGGKCVVNPSGGLISKGHPLGATGLAQLSELVWQLRGVAGTRQVPNVRYALQHNIGLGGAAVVALYKKVTPEPDNPTRVGYNPAVQPTPHAKL